MKKNVPFNRIIPFAAIFVFLITVVPLGVYFGVKQKQNLQSNAASASSFCPGQPGQTISGNVVKIHYNSLSECQAMCCTHDVNGQSVTKCGDMYFCGQGSPQSSSCTVPDGATGCNISSSESCGVIQTDCADGSNGNVQYDCSGCTNSAPACDTSQLNMTISNTQPNVGDTVTLSLSGNQGSTFLEDLYAPTGIINCPAFPSQWPTSVDCKIAASGSFTWTHNWKVCAMNDCSITSPLCSKSLTVNPLGPSATPSPTTPPIAACLNITVYDNTWNKITDLTTLRAGMVARLAVKGQTGGTYDAGRFRVNNGAWLPSDAGSTLLSPNGEYFFEYTIPSDITNFTVEAMVHETTQGWK